VHFRAVVTLLEVEPSSTGRRVRGRNVNVGAASEEFARWLHCRYGPVEHRRGHFVSPRDALFLVIDHFSSPYRALAVRPVCVCVISNES